ncbi:M23 family metallopeptidase [Streptomyces lichenis]|uniref:M23 family metallopeptidase n=1 Tax=Streptomyces lichenis TaxID=2306967 RepID=A0ABT0I5A0_9ACTN|nr:M23 family metallopeptidase [Streptomyces lichenis]MCK8676495.1 M23 family metallopeptidase [Streptomyces lichenis]
MSSGADGTFGSDVPDGSFEEWNPTEETVRPVRGRHRVAKQRGGLARSSTVLGVGVIAAVGAGGMATAQSKPPVSISLPDAVADKLPDAKSLPGIGSLISGDEESGEGAGGTVAAPETAALATTSLAGTADRSGAADAGEALRARILQQAEQAQASADAEARTAAERKAAEQAATEAAKQHGAAEKAAEAEKAKKEAAAKKAAEAKAKAEAEAKAQAAAEAEAEAEEPAPAEKPAEAAGDWSLPTSSYTITSTFGQAGSMWSSGYHTGLDLAAPTGTPAKAVHGATVKSAGWSGSYGYRIVLELSDGTEVWYCHLSSMTVAAGQQVGAGETIGRVGATGNVTGPHLHLEVHTPGGQGIDPLSWLRGKGLTV